MTIRPLERRIYVHNDCIIASTCPGLRRWLGSNSLGGLKALFVVAFELHADLAPHLNTFKWQIATRRRSSPATNDMNGSSSVTFYIIGKCSTKVV
jgi:hypothetical protein